MLKKIISLSILCNSINIELLTYANDLNENDIQKFANLNNSTNKKQQKNDTEIAKKLFKEAKAILINALPGEQNKAEKLLIECIRLNPNDIDAYIELSKLIQIQVSQGLRHPYELQKSVELVTEAYELAPNRPKVLFAKADILYYSGQAKAAEQLYLETLNQYPNHLDSYIEKARLFAEKKPTEAIENAKFALQNGASTDDISQSVAIAFTKLYQPEISASMLKEFSENYPDRWLWHKTALSYLMLKNFEMASYAFEKAIALGNDIESRLQLAVMQYSLQNKYKMSLDNLNKLLATLSKHTYINKTAFSLVYAHMSMAHFKNKNHSDAATAAVYSAETAYENKQFFVSLVTEYKKQNALYIVENALKYLIKEQPNFSLSYTIFGEIFRNQKRYDDSIDMFSKAIALDQSKDDIFAERGISYYKKTDYLNALNDFETALKIKPNTAIYIYNKACMLALLGKKSEALQNLKLALIEDKKLIELARFDSDFASLKSDSEYSSQFASIILEDSDDKWLATEKDSN
nr:hypothetical protein GTC16762_15100 [Pigmentibacter ruber]